MIEQINIALEQKGSGNFSAWVIEAAAGDCAQKKEFLLKQTKKRLTLLNCSENRSDQIEAI
ncbi:Qin prophage [Escherichia coli]|uniref:Qin prophage n=1 Tax=Escherichia coli TaxID=562 RepID=A0A2X1P1Q8_ECOLX|nr:Qin prophage [Escherichia coli]